MLADCADTPATIANSPADLGLPSSRAVSIDDLAGSAMSAAVDARGNFVFKIANDNSQLAPMFQAGLKFACQTHFSVVPFR